ncbi:MAG: MFS transporter [Sphingobium sp.]|nr:MFS transporter [Sphingobium sp.]
MSEQKSLAYEIRIVLLLGLAYGFAFYDRQTMSFLSPFVVKDFGLNNTEVGALGSGLSLTWALGAYFIGRWSDKVGKRKPFLLAFLLIYSICSVLSGLSNSFLPLLGTRVLMGAVEGPFLPVCLAIIAAASPDQRRGLNSGIVQNVFGSLLGNTLAPLLVVWIAVQWDWRTSFYLAGVPGLILFFFVWKFVEEPPKPAPQPVGEIEEGATMLALLKERNIALCAAMSPMLIGTIILTSIFLPLYLTGPRGYSPTTMSIITAIIGICPAVGAVIFTALSDRIGRKPPMIIGAASTALSPLACIYFPGSVAMLTVLMVIGTLGVGVFPLYMGVIPAETLKFRNIAAGMGIVVAVGELAGGVVAPVVSGKLADLSTLDAPLLIAAGMSVVGGVICLFLKETNPAVLARREAALAVA